MAGGIWLVCRMQKLWEFLCQLLLLWTLILLLSYVLGCFVWRLIKFIANRKIVLPQSLVFCKLWFFHALHSFLFWIFVATLLDGEINFMFQTSIIFDLWLLGICQNSSLKCSIVVPRRTEAVLAMLKLVPLVFFFFFLKIGPIRCWSCDPQYLVSKHAFLPGVGHVNCCGVCSHAFSQV